MKYLLIVFLLFCSFLSYGQNIQRLVESSNNHVRAMFNQPPKYNHLIVPGGNNSNVIVQNVQQGIIVNNFNVSNNPHIVNMFNDNSSDLDNFVRTNDKALLSIPKFNQGIINNPNQNLYRKNTTINLNNKYK